MSSAQRNQYEPDLVTLPGEILLEKLEELGMTQADLAERIGRTKKTVNEIIKGKAPILSETALQLERVLAIPARFWTNAEGQYREFLAREEERERLGDHLDWLKRDSREEDGAGRLDTPTYGPGCHITVVHQVDSIRVASVDSQRRNRSTTTALCSV
jgi:addiction module HigA family antidote